MKRLSLLILGGLALGSAGCTLTPKYTRPAAPVPTAWPALGSSSATAGQPAASALAWREFVSDAKLREVIALALENNRDLRLAALNVEMFQALYRIQRDALLPSVTATGGASKQRSSEQLVEPGKPVITESYNAGLGVLSWELDLFGRLRSLKDKALASYLGSVEARRGAQSVLISGVASAYLSLAADSEALALARNTLEAQEKSHALIRRQYEAGVATELELRQSQVPLETARVELARYTRLVAQDENALNLLVGTPVPSGLKPTALDGISAFREPSAGLPSEVLLNRPDVLQAESQLKAANADIGAARAAFFPSISLTGRVGTASSELSGLFDSGTRTWSFVPQATMPIFDARVWAAHRASKVQRKMALTQYEKAVQSAFREVADALAVRGTIDEQLTAQQALVEALAVTHKLATARYDKGVDSYLVVLDAQRSLFAAQQGLVSLRLARASSLVRLFAALGGGGDV